MLFRSTLSFPLYIAKFYYTKRYGFFQEYPVRNCPCQKACGLARDNSPFRHGKAGCRQSAAYRLRPKEGCLKPQGCTAVKNGLYLISIVIADDDPFFATERQIAQFFAEQDFHLYLLGVEMPGMSGLELSEKILTLHPGARIVLLTGRDRKSVV